MNISLHGNPLALKARRQKFGVGSLLFLLAFGTIFTGAGYVPLKQTAIDRDWKHTTGIVTGAEVSRSDSNSNTTYSSVVTYTVDGQSHRVSSSFSTGSYPHMGEQRDVAYDPSNPDDAKIVETLKTSWFLYLFPVCGIFVIVLAPILFMRSLVRSRKIHHLVHGGMKIQGVVTEITTDSSGNNRNSYKVVVSAVDHLGKARTYTSDPVNGIGSLAMADFKTSPIAIDVYIDITNPDDYYVDLSDIPSLTAGRITELITKAISKSKTNHP